MHPDKHENTHNHTHGPTYVCEGSRGSSPKAACSPLSRSARNPSCRRRLRASEWAMQRSFAFAGDTTKIMRLGVIEHYLCDIRPSASSSGGAARAVSRPDPERAVRRRDRQRCEMRPGSKLRICFALGLLTLSLTQDCEILRARGFSIPLDFGPRSVSVLLDGNIVIRHTSIPARDSTEKGWHNLTALQKGSAFCVDAPTLLGNETCDKKNYLILITSSTTSWKLDCPGVAQAPEGTPQCRHYLLYVLYLGLDSGPTSFYWKPNAVATRLKVINLSAEAKFHHETDVWAKDTATWMDVNLGRDPDGGPCRVYSKRLHLSYQCSETFNKSHFLPFLGIDKDHNRRPSYFAFNCSGIPEVVSEDVPHKTELPSPLEIVSHKTEPWFPFAIVAAVVVVVIGVVLVVITAVWVVVKVRKSRSSSQAAIPADDLHDPGRDDRESEHEYWDIDSVVLRAQLEERRATRTRHDGGTTSLHRCKSENSLHGAIRNGVSYECINPLYGAIHPGVRCKSENSLYGAIHPGVRPRGRNRVGRKTMPLMHDRESEHEYWDIDSPVMRAQPEERRATRTRHDGGTTSLRR